MPMKHTLIRSSPKAREDLAKRIHFLEHCRGANARTERLANKLAPCTIRQPCGPGASAACVEAAERLAAS